MRILIVNSVALNVGDAAILQGELRALRAAFGDAASIEVAEQTPEVARRLYPGIAFHAGLHPQHAAWPRWRSHGIVASLRKRRTSLAVRLLRWMRPLARLLLTAAQRAHLDRVARADLVVATGGTYFVEHYDFTAKADEVRAAHALARPAALFTQSLGPFTTARSRRLMRRVVGDCVAVFLRDQRSRGHLAGIAGEDARLHVHADAAFALAPGSAAAGAPAAAGAAPRRRRVAISVRHWSHFRGGDPGAGPRYRRAVADVARALAADGWEVTFLSTCQGVPEYWTDDSRVAAQLVAELLPGVPGVRVDGAFRGPEALIAELGTYDVAIATRMHFAILSLCAATPVVAIAYEFKSRELLRDLGYEAWAFDIEDVAGEGLLQAVREVVARGAPLRAEIARQAAALRADAIAPAARLRELLPPERAGR